MVLRLLIVGALLAASPASASNVLLAGTGAGNDTIQIHLESLGHRVTRSSSDALPADLSPFDTTWVHTQAALSPADITKLAVFVEAGRGVYLNGDGGISAPSNANGEALVNMTVTTGASITIGAAPCPFVFDASPNTSAVNRIAITPFAPAYMAFSAAGCVTGAAAANQLTAGSGGVRATAWRDADMVLGKGRIVIVMDSSWAGLGDPWIDEWVGNIQQFLDGTLFASSFEVGALAPDGILRCDSPVDGSSIDLVPGTNVPIMGTALGLSNVQVNGTSVAVAADQTFSTTVIGRYGLNFVELSATDGDGAAHTALCAFLGAERWSMEGAQFNEALEFRFDEAGLAKLKALFPPWFAGPTLQQGVHSSLVAANPILVVGCGFGTCITRVTYLSLATTFDSLQIAVNAAAENLDFAVQMDLRIGLRVRRQLGGINLGDIDGEVLFTNAIVQVSVQLGADFVTGRPVVAGGSINTSNTGTVSLQFPGLQPEFVNEVISVAEDSLFSRLGPAVFNGAAGLFEGLFAGFGVTPPAAGFPVGRLDGTANVMVALAPRSAVDLRVQNDLRLLTGLRVTAPAPPPNATGRFPLPPGLTPPARQVDTWSAAHVGVYNQVLQALWRVGAFDGTVGGVALGPGLPAGTSLSVQLRTMPVVTGFAPGNMASLDVGALDVVVAHPNLPPGLRVVIGARIQADAALVSNDLVFDGFVTDELHVSTGAVILDPAQQATLQGLVELLLVKVAGVALNDSLPVLPATVITIPASLAPYGFTPGSQLPPDPALVIEPNYIFLQGQF